MDGKKRRRGGEGEDSMNMFACYLVLIPPFQDAVTRNYSEKSINSILDYISTSQQVSATVLSDLQSLKTFGQCPHFSSSIPC